jgi:hypothetical protein
LILRNSDFDGDSSSFTLDYRDKYYKKLRFMNLEHVSAAISDFEEKNAHYNKRGNLSISEQRELEYSILQGEKVEYCLASWKSTVSFVK